MHLGECDEMERNCGVSPQSEKRPFVGFGNDVKEAWKLAPGGRDWSEVDPFLLKGIWQTTDPGAREAC